MWNPFRRKEGQVKIYSSLLSTAGLDTDVQLCPRTLRRGGSRIWKLSPKRFSPIMLCFPAYL